MRYNSVRVVAGILGLCVLGTGIALATGGIWDTLFPDSNSVSYSIELSNAADNSLDQKIEVTRGPIDTVTNTASVSITLTLQQPNVTLNSMSLQVGVDSNQDGTIQPGELTLVASGTISTQGGVTTATITNATMPINKDVYRVCYNRSDIGNHYDEIFSTNLNGFSNP